MSLEKNKKTKVCYVLSYKSPDYVRTEVLLGALSQIPGVELLTAMNTNKSVWRYIQTLWSLLKVRLQRNPDVYLLGFRGQEIFWPVRLLTVGKTLIFDEFINMHDWLGEEHGKLPKFLLWAADVYERMVIKCSHLVLTDTKLGAKKSAEVYKQSLSKFQHVYVGTNEALFKPQQQNKKENAKLEVLFYGNLLPLHGLPNILEAANNLKDRPIHFTIIGGKGKQKMINYVESYIEQNKLDKVTYKHWVDYNQLPQTIGACDVFLGGPFGNTSQAKRVITGKTFQSLAVGTATIVGKIKEDLGFVDKQNCLLVKQGSVDEIANCIKWSLEHKKQLIKIGRDGHRLYQERFSNKAVANELERILQTI